MVKYLLLICLFILGSGIEISNAKEISILNEEFLLSQNKTAQVKLIREVNEALSTSENSFGKDVLKIISNTGTVLFESTSEYLNRANVMVNQRDCSVLKIQGIRQEFIECTITKSSAGSGADRKKVELQIIGLKQDKVDVLLRIVTVDKLYTANDSVTPHHL